MDAIIQMVEADSGVDWMASAPTFTMQVKLKVHAV